MNDENYIESGLSLDSSRNRARRFEIVFILFVYTVVPAAMTLFLLNSLPMFVTVSDSIYKTLRYLGIW